MLDVEWGREPRSFVTKDEKQKREIIHL